MLFWKVVLGGLFRKRSLDAQALQNRWWLGEYSYICGGASFGDFDFFNFAFVLFRLIMFVLRLGPPMGLRGYFLNMFRGVYKNDAALLGSAAGGLIGSCL